MPGATNYTCLCPARYTGNCCGSQLAPRPRHPISGTCPVFFWGLRLSPEAWSCVGTRLGTPLHPLSAPQGISASSHPISARPSSAPASTAPRASPPARGPGEPWSASGLFGGGCSLQGGGGQRGGMLGSRSRVGAAVIPVLPQVRVCARLRGEQLQRGLRRLPGPPVPEQRPLRGRGERLLLPLHRGLQVPPGG